jgi:hypothetical protein
MKMAKYLGVVAGLLLFIPIAVFAKTNDKTEHKVELYEPVQVGSTQLTPGTYKVEWQGTGNSVPVTFIKNGKTVFSTQARLVEQTKPTNSDEVVTHKTNKNQEQLDELIFGHHKEALSFTPESSGM